MSTALRRARAADRRPADVGTRLRVERLVSHAALEPDGLPPSAILVVRSLADPLPGRVSTQAPGVRAPAEWERAVRGALGDHLRQAARPARGVLPDGAPAVLFADTAEMIAVFARDAAAGAAAGRWWWTALLRGLAGSIAPVAALWTREARHVPAALEHLAAWGQAERVLSSLPADQAARVLAAVARVFDVSALLAAPSPAPPPSLSGEDERRGSGGWNPLVSILTIAGAPVDRADPTTPMTPPWERVMAPETVSRALAPEARALMGASLALHRAPLVARSTAFATAFARWRAAASAESATTPEALRPSSSTISRPEPVGDRRSIGDRGAGDEARRPASTESPSTDPSDEGEARKPVFPLIERLFRPDEAATASTSDPPVRTASTSGERVRSESTFGDSGHKDAVVSRNDGVEAGFEVEEAAFGEWRGPTVETAETYSGLCGVFYLVNAVRSLGFFRALDRHFGVPPVIGGWGWVELLARALLGPRAVAAADDPLWRVLAELDGRAPEVPAGTGFLAPSIDTLPDDWARILASAGDRQPGSVAPLGIRPSPDLQRFLDLVVPFVRLRLEAALRAAGAGDEALETALLRRVGLVQVTRSHVDVRMALDQVSLPARLAGLDATPGWVPELARVVTIHFG